MLGVLAAADPDDAATAAGNDRTAVDYTKFLDPNGLHGARIGIARNYFGFHDAVDAVMEESLAALRRQGAILIDPAELPNMDKLGEVESIVFNYELKADLNAYLARLGVLGALVRTLKDVIAFNERETAAPRCTYFGQDHFIKAEAKGPLTTARSISTPWRSAAG